MANLPAVIPRAGRGRPLYSEELAKELCERLATGEETFTAICRDPAMPSVWAVYDWEDTKPDFAQMLARAWRFHHQALRDEQVEIARNRDIDVEVSVTQNKDGVSKTVRRRDAIEHRKLNIWARQLLLDRYYNHGTSMRGTREGDSTDAGDTILIKGGLPES